MSEWRGLLRGAGHPRCSQWPSSRSRSSVQGASGVVEPASVRHQSVANPGDQPPRRPTRAAASSSRARRVGARVAPPIGDLVLFTDAATAPDACYDKITFTFRPTGKVVPPGYDAATSTRDPRPRTTTGRPGEQPARVAAACVARRHVHAGIEQATRPAEPAVDLQREPQPVVARDGARLLVHKHSSTGRHGDMADRARREAPVHRRLLLERIPPTPKVNVLIMR